MTHCLCDPLCPTLDHAVCKTHFLSKRAVSIDFCFLFEKNKDVAFTSYILLLTLDPMSNFPYNCTVCGFQTHVQGGNPIRLYFKSSMEFTYQKNIIDLIMQLCKYN